jgi:hypothetical protein
MTTCNHQWVYEGEKKVELRSLPDGKVVVGRRYCYFCPLCKLAKELKTKEINGKERKA